MVDLLSRCVGNSDSLRRTGHQCSRQWIADRTQWLAPISLALGLDIITIPAERFLLINRLHQTLTDRWPSRSTMLLVGVPNAFAIAQPGDIVRIVGNGGSDSNVATITNNLTRIRR